ncbi:MAG: hypothetical protein Tsb002_18670 [Wenzhouxiangellaceae bacterium]
MKPLLTLILALGLISQGLAADAPQAPAFQLADSNGEMISLPRTDKKQGADIYLFWATWCPYCKALMPHLQSIIDEYGEDQITVYALNIREDGDPQGYLESQGFDFILLPEADAVATEYRAKTTPGVLLVDRAGKIQFNLYQLVANDSASLADLSHRQKAARRAPWWAAELRQAIDRVLASDR